MLKTLCVLAGLGYCPTLQIADTPRMAQINPFLGIVTISPAFKLTKDELAFVWSHELGHIVLRHHEKASESDIDIWAIALMQKAGHDCRAALAVLKRAAPDRLMAARSVCHVRK